MFGFLKKKFGKTDDATQAPDAVEAPADAISSQAVVSPAR